MQLKGIIRAGFILVLLVSLLTLASCSSQYGAFFARSSGTPASAQTKLLPESTLQAVNKLNYKLLTQKNTAEGLSKQERETLRAGLSNIKEHFQAGGKLPSKDKKLYRKALMAMVKPTLRPSLNPSEWASTNRIGGLAVPHNEFDEAFTDRRQWLNEGKAFNRQAQNQIEEDESEYYLDQAIAALLCLFLGAFGVHRFYLGYNKAGYWQLGLFLGGAFILLLFVIIALAMAFLTLEAFLLFFFFFLFLASLFWIPLAVWLLLDLIRILVGDLRREEFMTGPDGK